MVEEEGRAQEARGKRRDITTEREVVTQHAWGQELPGCVCILYGMDVPPRASQEAPQRKRAPGSRSWEPRGPAAMLQCCFAGVASWEKRAALPWRVWQSGNLLLVGQLLGRRICTALCSEPPAAMSQHAQNQGRTRQIGAPRRGAIKQAKQPGNGAVLSDKGAAVRDLLCDKAREGNPSSSSASPCPLTLPLAVLPRRAAGP
jgi:hypothetical protein